MPVIKAGMYQDEIQVKAKTIQGYQSVLLFKKET